MSALRPCCLRISSSAANRTASYRQVPPPRRPFARHGGYWLSPPAPPATRKSDAAGQTDSDVASAAARVPATIGILTALLLLLLLLG